MHKLILAFGLVLLLITGCAAHNNVTEDPVRAELLKPAPPETDEADADKEQNTENKDNEESKGVAYYLTVGVGAVFYTGLCVLNEIVGH